MTITSTGWGPDITSPGIRPRRLALALLAAAAVLWGGLSGGFAWWPTHDGSASHTDLLAFGWLTVSTAVVALLWLLALVGLACGPDRLGARVAAVPAVLAAVLSLPVAFLLLFLGGALAGGLGYVALAVAALTAVSVAAIAGLIAAWPRRS
ncbi:hypothetical protein CFP65_5613 [Kitasatospora sp. MMS16-BH015]|uniref:hypothetical protein n=1 Tax=Kitasatospora sp. MMS16-BH015 TaxID=2018025 RepID=UPI000CA2A29A|nr:hypothetical protein [Kitasatospora sp. MMS16-BH015]AUG80310.1 hypothetical protein CFP65_5613 [Kitasatospora sp. MMS16-BH015]